MKIVCWRLNAAKNCSEKFNGRLFFLLPLKLNDTRKSQPCPDSRLRRTVASSKDFLQFFNTASATTRWIRCAHDGVSDTAFLFPLRHLSPGLITVYAGTVYASRSEITVGRRAMRVVTGERDPGKSTFNCQTKTVSRPRRIATKLDGMILVACVHKTNAWAAFLLW